MASWAAPTACSRARVTAIATGFRTLAKLDQRLQSKITFTGNPVRREVMAAAATPYAAPQPGGKLSLLVFGGSQGARVMAEIVPPAIERLAADLRARLNVVQQARAEDLDTRARHLCAAWRRCRLRTVLFRLAGTHGGGASGDFALRRLDGGRTLSHRPAGHLGAAAALARSGSVRQRRRVWRTPARRSASSSATSPRNGWRRRSRAWPETRRGFPTWHRPPNPPVPSMPPSGWRTWC